VEIKRYLAIDEEGYFAFDGRRVEDEALGQELLDNLEYDDKGRLLTRSGGQAAIVEAFDEPLIGRHVRAAGPGEGEIDLAYHRAARFAFTSLSLDEWDRLHGITLDKQIPFVFARAAQVEFFDLLDAFDDDSVTIGGRRYPTPPWLQPNADARQDQFWTDIYRQEEPGWDLGRESAVLPAVLPQLKLSKCRVLVLGCGPGHDAAYLARQGHTVTAVDFSVEAIQRAKATYGDVSGLNFVQSDAFAPPEEWAGRFDLIFEHTFYCAISPEKRDDLVRVWKRMLHGQGHLLGVFFAMSKRSGPPFGGSEWEIRERLKKSFDFLFWTRWRLSPERRQGKELVVYARRRDG
jgi:SAM-dependent methyltransferase